LSHAIETRYAGSPAGSTTAITAIVGSRLSAQVVVSRYREAFPEEKANESR